jgi:hypothetical protein
MLSDHQSESIQHHRFLGELRFLGARCFLKAPSAVKRVAPGSVSENSGQLPVNLRERGAQRMLDRWVGPGTKITGNREHGMREEFPNADATEPEPGKEG